MGACGHSVVVDPGRHRLFVATAEATTGAPTPQLSRQDGLVLRWHDANAKRFSERLVDLAGVDQAEAVRTASDVGHLILELEPTSAGTVTNESSIKVAIPASFGPTCRQALIDGFANAGVTVLPSDLVERPIAAAAGWLAHRAQTTGRMPTDPVLVIDNDGGELSIAALDPATSRLLFVRPLSVGPHDDPTAVTERLRDAVASTARLTHRGDLIRETDWATVSASIGDVIITGTSAKEPALTDLITSVLPAAHPMPDPLVPSECAVVVGLTNLDQFDGWTACWPTLNVSDGANPVLMAGPTSNAGRDATIERSNGQSIVAFGGYGAIQARAGRSAGAGVLIPEELKTPTVRSLDDGRLLILGDEGTRPLALQVSWPCPGQRVESVQVRSIGRRALELVSRSVDRSEDSTTPVQAQSLFTTSSQS